MQAVGEAVPSVRRVLGCSTMGTAVSRRFQPTHHRAQLRHKAEGVVTPLERVIKKAQHATRGSMERQTKIITQRNVPADIQARLEQGRGGTL